MGREVWEFPLVLDILSNWLCFLMRAEPPRVENRWAQEARIVRNLAGLCRVLERKAPGPREGGRVGYGAEKRTSFIRSINSPLLSVLYSYEENEPYYPV